MSTFRRLLPATLAASAALAVSVAYSALAAPRYAPPPITVATVDIIQLIDKLNEKSDFEVTINALAQRIQAELATRKKELEELAGKADKGTDAEKQATRDMFALKKLQLDEWSNFKQAEIDRERALMWQSIYKHIREESEKLAAAEGYDLVLVNDSVTDLILRRDSQVPQEQQAQEQIMRRRVLYANKTLDVTARLITRMNNARTAAAGSAPAAPAKGTAPAGGSAPAGGAPAGTPPATPPAGGSSTRP